MLMYKVLLVFVAFRLLESCDLCPLVNILLRCENWPPDLPNALECMLHSQSSTELCWNTHLYMTCHDLYITQVNAWIFQIQSLIVLNIAGADRSPRVSVGPCLIHTCSKEQSVLRDTTRLHKVIIHLQFWNCIQD